MIMLPLYELSNQSVCMNNIIHCYRMSLLFYYSLLRYLFWDNTKKVKECGAQAM